MSDTDLEIRRQQSNTDLLGIFNDTFNQLERNRLENIAILVPPGPLPDDFRSYLQIMKTKLKDDYDVRLDIVLVGSATIPEELRDLSAKSHGSVLTVTDLDEVGAIAQRLKNEQSAGAWVIVPQVSAIPQVRQAAIQQLATQPAPGAQIQAPEDARKFAMDLGTAIQQLAAQPAAPGAQIQAPEDARKFAMDLGTEIDKSELIIEGMIRDASEVLGKLRNAPANQAQQLPEAVKREASGVPDKLRNAPANQAQQLPEPVKRQVDNTFVNLMTFKTLITELREKEKEARDLKQPSDVARKTNAEVLILIAKVRDSLKSLEDSISLAAKTTLIDPNLKDLIHLAKGYYDPDEPIRNPATNPAQPQNPATNPAQPQNPATNPAQPQNPATNPAQPQNPATNPAQPQNPATNPAQGQNPATIQNPAQGQNAATSPAQAEKISKLERLRRFLRLHEKWYEAAILATKDYVPIYKRLDRTKLDLLRQQVENVQVMQAVGHPVAPTIGAGLNEVRLSRFYVEGGGKMGDFNFELVIGLARPLPQIYNEETKRVEPRLPTLELFSDNGIIAANARNMKLEKSTSDAETLFVFRAQDPSRLPEGWYTPVLRLDREVMSQIRAPYNEINFTFSVASLRPNLQLIASLRQPDGTATRGSLRSGDQEAIVEVLVSAGSPIRGAKVYGYFQKISNGYAEIETQEVDFHDEGKAQPLDADTLKEDGVYTAKIPIGIGNVTTGTEFRVFIRADTTDGNATFVALDDPTRFKQDTQDEQTQPLQLAKTKAKKSTLTKTLLAFQAQGKEDQKKVEGAAPKFQRATSLHFRVDP